MSSAQTLLAAHGPGAVGWMPLTIWQTILLIAVPVIVGCQPFWSDLPMRPGR
jgi:hypothetical protein